MTITIAMLAVLVVAFAALTAPPLRRYVYQRRRRKLREAAHPIEPYLGEVIEPIDPRPVRRSPLPKPIPPRRLRS